MFRKIILILIIGLIGITQLVAQSANEIVVDEDVQLIPLQDSIYIHTTWHYFDQFGRFPSNGLIVIRDGEALLVDTPMDNEKTEKLCRYLEDSMSVKVTHFMAGHFHNDCLGGLDYLQSIGVESLANSMTIEKCKEDGLALPSQAFTDSLRFDFNGEQIECRFFGAGHTFDNITVWIPAEKILFGGCLVRAADARGLGNLSDAVVGEWDRTIEKILAEYPDTKTVIPGHGRYGGPELLTHTIELVKMERE